MINLHRKKSKESYQFEKEQSLIDLLYLIILNMLIFLIK